MGGTVLPFLALFVGRHHAIEWWQGRFFVMLYMALLIWRG
jgi:hypothetical protein